MKMRVRDCFPSWTELSLSLENDVDPLWISITIENRGAINSGQDHLACRIRSQRDAIMAACPRRL